LVTVTPSMNTAISSERPPRTFIWPPEVTTPAVLATTLLVLAAGMDMISWAEVTRVVVVASGMTIWRLATISTPWTVTTPGFNLKFTVVVRSMMTLTLVTVILSKPIILACTE
jgi:hypothetical protein